MGLYTPRQPVEPPQFLDVRRTPWDISAITFSNIEYDFEAHTVYPTLEISAPADNVGVLRIHAKDTSDPVAASTKAVFLARFLQVPAPGSGNIVYEMSGSGFLLGTNIIRLAIVPTIAFRSGVEAINHTKLSNPTTDFSILPCDVNQVGTTYLGFRIRSRVILQPDLGLTANKLHALFGIQIVNNHSNNITIDHMRAEISCFSFDRGVTFRDPHV